VFLGDDGFGVAVAEALAASEWPDGVHVEDFGHPRDGTSPMRSPATTWRSWSTPWPRGGAPGTL
jgi:hypothetical protein